MNAYSKDLGLKVIDAVERGVPRREVSELVGISRATISRYGDHREAVGPRRLDTLPLGGATISTTISPKRRKL